MQRAREQRTAVGVRSESKLKQCKRPSHSDDEIESEGKARFRPDEYKAAEKASARHNDFQLDSMPSFCASSHLLVCPSLSSDKIDGSFSSIFVIRRFRTPRGPGKTWSTGGEVEVTTKLSALDGAKSKTKSGAYFPENKNKRNVDEGLDKHGHICRPHLALSILHVQTWVRARIHIQKASGGLRS